MNNWSKIVGLVLMAAAVVTGFTHWNWQGAILLGAFGYAIYKWG